MTRARIAHVDDLKPGSMKRVEIGDLALCLAHVAGEGFRAIGDECTHEDQSLSDGELWGCNVECPAHGSRFNLDTGAVTGVPATIPAKVYEISVAGDEIFVEL